MTSQREIDRLLDIYFDDGRDELADRVIDAALDTIDHTRQRRAIARAVEVPNDDHAIPPRDGRPDRRARARRRVPSDRRRFETVDGRSQPASPGPAWTVTGSPSIDRGNARVAIQLNGRPCCSRPGEARRPSAELYDPATGTWTATGSLSFGRAYPIAATLADGKVLIAGGSDNAASNASCTTRPPALDPDGDMTEAANQGFGITLADGRVLAAGGGNDGGKSSAGAIRSRHGNMVTDGRA